MPQNVSCARGIRCSGTAEKRKAYPQTTLLLVLLVLILTSCRSTAMKKADAKFDAPLRHRMHEMDQQDDPTPIVCLIQLKTPLAGSQLRQLEDAGLRLVNVMNDIAVAEGSAAALRRAARYDFVLWLELSRTQSPSNAGRD